MTNVNKTIALAVGILVLSVGFSGCNNSDEGNTDPGPAVSKEAQDRLQPSDTAGATGGGAAASTGPEAPPPPDGN
jgi:hypothetical protein